MDVEAACCFLHWILFRIGVHLGTISAGWNSLWVRFFWFWIVTLGAILYQMPGLSLAAVLYCWFSIALLMSVMRWHCCTVEWTCRNPYWWFGIQSCGFKSLLIFLVQAFLILLKLTRILKTINFIMLLSVAYQWVEWHTIAVAKGPRASSNLWPRVSN